MAPDPINPFLARQGRIGQSGRRSEKKVAKVIGGSLTPASGAALQKGDISTPEWLYEAKSTTNNSIGLQHAWLSKITAEATLVGKTPAVTLSFVNESGRSVRDGAWVAIPQHVFLEILATARQS